MFSYLSRKREAKEILRLHKIITVTGNKKTVKEIESQIIYCESLPWKEYKLLCRKY